MAEGTKAKSKKPVKVKKRPSNEFTLPDGVILDTSTLDTGGSKTTEKEKRFVFYYTFPGTDAFQCMARAAARAGYKDAAAAGYKLRSKPNVAAAIKHVMDSKVKIDLEEEYHKIIELKKRRIHYDIGEYVEKREKHLRDKEGSIIATVEVEELKDLEELTPEQRQAIDGMDYKGTQGIRIYNFADRDRAMADVINLYNKINGTVYENAYDVELTAEIIKGKLSVKLGARKKKEEIGKTAGFVQAGEKRIEEL
jgi:hypothetical protein